MSKTKDTTTVKDTNTTEAATAEVSPIDAIINRLDTLNETLFRAGQLLASIDERLGTRGGQGPSAAYQADYRRPLSNQPQWSQNVSGGW